MKILDVKPLSQRDPRWVGQRLGTVDGITIGSDGCVVTSHSMLLTFHGFPILPNALDDFLTENGLYFDDEGDGPASDNLWLPHNISKVWDKMKFITTTYCYTIPAPISEIVKAIDRNQPPTLWLMNGGVAHNVLAVGYETVNGKTQIYVADPWTGEIVRIDKRWGDSAEVILSVDYYEGPMPTTTPLIEVPKSDFEGLVFKSTQHDKTCKTWEFSDSRNTTAEQIDEKVQKSINAYKGQASQALTAKAESETKLATATQEVKNRIEQIGRLKDELTNNEKVHAAELEALKNTPNPSEGLVTTLKAQVEEYKGKYAEEAKAKGRALNDLATAKTQLQVCQQGIKTKSLWEAIKEFLMNTKVQK